MTPRRVVTFLGLLLVLASPAPAGTVRCTTYHKKSLGRLHTVCTDGTRGVSTWNRTLGHWDTTVMTPARPPHRGR